MGYGLFGKLPQKRDFVSTGLPHQVLHPIETWLQSAVAASRNEIGGNWQNYYMVAPIWNFWLGPQILGTTCAGALMPSVDQVGRYFPLAIIYVADPGEDLPPPLIDPMSEWYQQIDQRLLAVLSAEGQIEITSVVAGLPQPQPSGVSMVSMAPVSAPRPAMASPPPAAAVPPSPAPAAPPEPVAAPAPAAAEPATAGGSDWDMPSMPADAMASIRMATASKVEPIAPGAAAGDPWGDGPIASNGAAQTSEPRASDGMAGALNGVDSSPAEASPAIAVEPPVVEPASAAALSPDPNGVDGATDAEPTPPPAPESVSGAATGFAELPDLPAEPAAAAPDTVAPPEPAEPAPSQQDWAPPRIHVTEFKGGLLSLVEPHRSLAEAAGPLIEADYRNAAQGRSFWWCETSQSGSAQLHTKQGLPDPYFFSRMLMWQPQ